MKKRLFSLLLVLAMVASMLPLAVFNVSAATLPNIPNLHRGVLANGESPNSVYWDAVDGVEEYEVKLTTSDGKGSTKYCSETNDCWGNKLFDIDDFSENGEYMEPGTYSVSVTGGYKYGDRFIYTTNTATIDITSKWQLVGGDVSSMDSNDNVARGEELMETLSEDGKSARWLRRAAGAYYDFRLDRISGYPQFTLIGAPDWVSIISSKDYKDNYIKFAPPSTCETGKYTFGLGVATSDVDGLLMTINLTVGGYKGRENEYWIQNLTFENPTPPTYFGIWQGQPVWQEEVMEWRSKLIQGSTGNEISGDVAESKLNFRQFSIALLDADDKVVQKNHVIDIGKYRYRYFVGEYPVYSSNSVIFFDENMSVYLGNEKVDVVIEESQYEDTSQKYKHFKFYSPWLYVYDEKPEINSVLVNGESLADGGAVTANNGNVTIKTNYDGLSDAMKDYGCSVKQLAAYYLNGEKINVAMITPVDNGDGTATKTYSRTLNPGDELRVESWLEVRWPDGHTDRADEHTVTVIYPDKQYINYVDVVDIDLPEAGARPDTECEILSAHLDEKKTKIEWFECDKNGSYVSATPLSATDLYKKNTYYRVNVTVYPREGYVFDSRYLNLNAYINDSWVEHYFSNDGLVLFAYYNVHEVDTKNTIEVFLTSKDTVTLKDGDYLAQNSDTPTTAAQSDNYMYYKDGVLYLKNYKRDVHLRYSEKHLEVDFSGDNAICGFESNYDDYDYTAIAFYGGADDYLYLNGLGRCSCPITAYAAFFNGGRYTISDGSYAAFWWTDYIEVNDGADIFLPLSQFGPFTEADVTLCVNEGEIEFSDGGTWQSDWLLADLTIANGTAYVKGSNADAEYALWDQVSDFNDYAFLLVQNKKIVTYKVVFIDDDNTVLDMVHVNEGETVAQPADPVKDGYTFLGWYTDNGDLFDFSTPITENTYLTAKYEVVYHVVKFMVDDSEWYSCAVVDGEPVEAPADPVKDGYNFLGWYTDDDEAYNFAAPVTDDVHLTAWFEQNEAEVEYIDTIHIEGLSAPQYGQVVKDLYKVLDVAWETGTFKYSNADKLVCDDWDFQDNNHQHYAWNSTDTIAEGSYYWAIYFNRKAGYAFADDLTVTVDGVNNANVEVEYDGDDWAIVYVKYEVTNPAEPPVGAIPGDLNGDGAVNNRDLALLQQYINKWEVTIDLDAADVNDDGAVNNRDLALMQQYINKWDVVLK